VLPLCTEALGISCELLGTPKLLVGQFSKLCELDYWNETVVNVAHDMIPVCMEFMHVLVQYPVRGYDA
jgi:hypothetical protein